jgi:hypothetical protein
MRHGLRLLPVTLGVFAALAANAHAYVYWTDYGPELTGGGTTLGRANLDASGITNTFIEGASSPLGVAVDSHYVYWANGPTNSIGRANLDGAGANPRFIPNVAAGGGFPSPVDVAVQNGEPMRSQAAGCQAAGCQARVHRPEAEGQDALEGAQRAEEGSLHTRQGHQAEAAPRPQTTAPRRRLDQTEGRHQAGRRHEDRRQTRRRALEAAQTPVAALN